MVKILHIDSAITGDLSVSRRFTKATVDALLVKYPDSTVEYLDLAATPPMMLSPVSFGLMVGRSATTDEAKADAASSEEIIAQFLAAEVIVLGAPLYNFSVSAQLKVWFDRLAVAGKTFKYVEGNPIGLVPNPTVFVVSSRGGVYSSGPSMHLDHQEKWVLQMLRFFGVRDIRVIRAEGTRASGGMDSAVEGATQDIANHVNAPLLGAAAVPPSDDKPTPPPKKSSFFASCRKQDDDF